MNCRCCSANNPFAVPIPSMQSIADHYSFWRSFKSRKQNRYAKCLKTMQTRIELLWKAATWEHFPTLTELVLGSRCVWYSPICKQCQGGMMSSSYLSIWLLPWTKHYTEMNVAFLFRTQILTVYVHTAWHSTPVPWFWLLPEYHLESTGLKLMRGQKDHFQRHSFKHFLELGSQLLHANHRHISGKNCFLEWKCTGLSCAWGISHSSWDMQVSCCETARRWFWRAVMLLFTGGWKWRDLCWQIGKIVLRLKFGRRRWIQRKEKKRIVG